MATIKSIKEKAKAYDEAIERAKEKYAMFEGMQPGDVLEDVFPELKESEGKRMIQYFKDLAPFDKADELYEKYGFSHKDAIAWLEKQGEHANFLSKIQVGDKVTLNEDGVLVNLTQLKRVVNKGIENAIKAKQGEQNLADKVEPKFKVGDTVKDPYGDTYHIIEIGNGSYKTDDGRFILFTNEKFYTLFKPAWSDEGKAVLDALIRRLEGEDVYISPQLAVKRLKSLKEKVLHQQQDWSKKDEMMLDDAIGAIGAADYYTYDDKQEIKNWLKSLKDRVQPHSTWKPSDEQMNTLEYYMHTLVCNEHKEILFGLYADLKKLKG